MRGGSRSRGYTIIEVLIFLAVSGFMFVVAAAFVSGKQARSEFRQGLNEFNAQTRAVINDVSNGYFEAASNFNCTADNAGNPPVLSFSSPKSQGTNQGCVFSGKVMHFAVRGTDRLGYNVYTVASRQYVASAKDNQTPVSFLEAQPILVYDTGATPPRFALIDREKVPWNIKITKVVSAGSAQPVNSVGFFNAFGRYDSGGTLHSDGEVVVVPFAGPLDVSETAMVGILNGGMKTIGAVSNPDIMVCLEGGDSQYGLLRIGGSGSERLSTSVKVYNRFDDQPAECK